MKLKHESDRARERQQQAELDLITLAGSRTETNQTSHLDEDSVTGQMC